MGSYCLSRYNSEKNAKNVLHLNQCRHGHVWSWTVPHFKRSWGGCECFDMHKNCAGEVSLYFLLKLNTLGVLNLPTDESLKDWGQHVVARYLENVIVAGYIWIRTSFRVLVWGSYSWSLSNHFRYILCLDARNEILR